MAKVYIDKDECYSLFVWGKEMLDILPQPEHLLTEVPDEILEEYFNAVAALSKAEEKIGYYYERVSPDRRA